MRAQIPRTWVLSSDWSPERGGEQRRCHQQSQHKQNTCCSSTRKASPAHTVLSERVRECHPCGGLWATAGPWERHQALSGHKPCPLSGRVECSEPRPTVITAATMQVFFFLARVEWQVSEVKRVMALEAKALCLIETWKLSKL